MKFILVCFLAVSLSSCATEEENRALAAGIAIGTILGQQVQKGGEAQAGDHEVNNAGHEVEQGDGKHDSSKKHGHEEERDDD